MQDDKHLAREQDIKLANRLTGKNHPPQQNACEPKKHAQVLIVGAGLAGLAAAQRLHEAGISDVIILDALDRIGGRVHTVAHSDYLLELGAQWLHGANENPLYQWLTSMEMLDDFEDASLSFKGLYCTNLGENISSSLVSRVLEIVCESKLLLSSDENYLDKLSTEEEEEEEEEEEKEEGDKQSQAAAKSLVINTPRQENCSRKFKNASQVFKRHLDMRMRQDDELARNKQLVHGIFEWFLRYETIENCCDTMDEVSTQSYTDWTDLGEGTLLNFKDGYHSLLHWFCQHFPHKQWLHLSTQVLNVEMLSEGGGGGGGGGGTTAANNPGGAASCYWYDSIGGAHNSPILIKYKANSSQDKQQDKVATLSNDVCGEANTVKTIECDHVIVTSSLGFLKSNHETLFTPKLPRVKQELISSIGFGTVNKIVLQFESPFWLANCGVKLVWSDGDEDLGSGPGHSFPEWARDILAFDVVRRQPNLLIGWIGGRGAKLIEHETDEAVGKVCLRILDKFLPPTHKRPSRLIACLCSRWHSNPFIRGSYSFQSMGSFGLNVDKLHEPIYNHGPSFASNELATTNSNGNSTNQLGSSSGSRVPRVLFAGEATAGKLYSTTHGAIISGWREADRLKDHLQGNTRVNIQPISNECRTSLQV